MRWYLNDASLQAQFSEVSDFVSVLRNLLALRQQFDQLRSNLYVTRTFGQRQVRDNLSFVQLLGQPAYRETRSQVLRWLDRAGPFVDDDRSPEVDDYFEFEDQDPRTGNNVQLLRRNAKFRTVTFNRRSRIAW